LDQQFLLKFHCWSPKVQKITGYFYHFSIVMTFVMDLNDPNNKQIFIKIKDFFEREVGSNTFFHPPAFYGK